MRVSAPEFVARTDTVVVGFQTTHSVPLTPATPALTFVYNANPVFPDEAIGTAATPRPGARRTPRASSGDRRGDIDRHRVGDHSIRTSEACRSSARTRRRISRVSTAARPACRPTEPYDRRRRRWFVSSGGRNHRDPDFWGREYVQPAVPVRVGAAPVRTKERLGLLRTAPGGRATTAPPPRPRGGGVKRLHHASTYSGCCWKRPPVSAARRLE